MSPLLPAARLDDAVRGGHGSEDGPAVTVGFLALYIRLMVGDDVP